MKHVSGNELPTIHLSGQAPGLLWPNSGSRTVHPRMAAAHQREAGSSLSQVWILEGSEQGPQEVRVRPVLGGRGLLALSRD